MQMTPVDELKELQKSAADARTPLYQYLGGPTRFKVRVLKKDLLAGKRAVSANFLDELRSEAADVLLLNLPQLGIRQVMKLSALAETHYVGVVLTGTRQEPWLSAGIHVAAALPNFIALESDEAAEFLEVRP